MCFQRTERISMIKAKRDILNSIILLLFCGLAYYGASQIPIRSLGKTEADFFPKIIIGIVALLSVILLVQSFIRLNKEKDSKLNLSIRHLIKENYKVILTFALFGIYVFALNTLGYFISSILFLYAIYYLLAPHKKMKHQWAVLLGIVSFTLLLLVIFQQFLSVFLPRGIFF